jgi:hypothetical protein
MGFDSMVLLVAWEIWKERNHRTFQGDRLSPPQLVQRIIDEAATWMGGGLPGNVAVLNAWR